MTTTAPVKIVPLTSARFFAAFYVMLYHTTIFIPLLRDHDRVLSRIAGLGNVSVSFFFMLSGFILAFVYLKDDKPINKRRFFMSRVARIYPVYLAAVLLDLPKFLHTQLHLFHAGLWPTMLTILATINLVQSWFVNMRGIDPPSWSLSTEAFFYLVFPFVGPLLWRLRGRSSWWISLLIYIAGVLLVQAMSKMQPYSSAQSYHPVPYLFVFFLGIMLANLFLKISRDVEQLRKLQRAAPWMLVGGLAVFLAIPVFALPIPETLLEYGQLAPLFAVIILGFASGNYLISRLFSPKWLVVLGEASYALYLIHVPLSSILRVPLERYGIPMVIAYFLITAALSVASLKWLETPLRHWILDKERVRSLESEVTSALSQ